MKDSIFGQIIAQKVPNNSPKKITWIAHLVPKIWTRDFCLVSRVSNYSQNTSACL